MNLLDLYLSYANINESPKSYHVWSGLSLISQVVGRRFYTDEELYKVFPNMYVVLAGPPGVAKSTAMDVTVDLFKDHFPKLALCPASITKEALIQTMAKKEDNMCLRSHDENGKTIKYAQMSVFADELVSLITCGGNPTGMIDFLTHIFGCKNYRETTKNKGDNEIINPFISVLAGCTITTLRQLVQSKVISGGMSRRCVFVVEDKNQRPVARVRRTVEQSASGQIFIERLKKLALTSGEFKWHDDADTLYRKWYDENFYRCEKTSSEVMQHFLRTKPTYCIKVSMLIALGEEAPQLFHTVDSFQKAIDIVTAVEDGAHKLFGHEGRNELAPIAEEVERFLKGQKALNVTNVRARFWKELKNGDLKELDVILEQLKRVGKITMSSQLQGNTPVTLISWAETTT